jgi:Fe-S-cluster-containing hydrogenase component 2
MIQGKLAANAAACQLGYLSGDRFAEVQKESQASLAQIRAGMFGPGKKGRSDIQATDEGCPLSQSLLTKGYLAEEELSDFPATTWGGKTRVVLECTQNIPCDPCQDICPRGCIKVGSDITALPLLVPERECTGCGLCVGVCSGQAIFLINDAYDKTGGTVGLPYEFYPLPAKGDVGWALDRSGTEIGEAVVVDVRSPKALDKTAMLVIRVAREDLGRARFFKAASTDRESGAAL